MEIFCCLFVRVCMRVFVCVLVKNYDGKAPEGEYRNSLEFNKIELISSPLKREHITMISFKVNERGFSFVELKRNKVVSKRTQWENKNGGMRS